MRQSLLLAFLALFSCSAAVAQSTDHSANGLELKGVFTPARAMKLIYGSYDNSREVSQWKPKRAKSYPSGWPDKIEAGVLLDSPFVESGSPKHLFVTWARPKERSQGEFTCHSCGVLIGIALFSGNSDKWRVDASDLQFGEYGELGEPPSISLQPVGPDHFGLLIPSSFGSGGIATDSITVVIRHAGEFLNALSGQIAESWDDDGCSGTVTAERKESCFAYDGGFEMVPNAHAKYYDLLLTKRIYRSFFQKHPVGTTVTRYRFDGSKYVPQKAPNSSASHPN